MLKFAFLHPEENTVEIKEMAPFILTVFYTSRENKNKDYSL